MQLYLLLPLIGGYVPEEIMDFMKALRIILFSFKFIPVKDLFSLFDYDQTTSYLKLLGLESSSAIENMSSVILVFLALILTALLIYLIKV